MIKALIAFNLAVTGMCLGGLTVRLFTGDYAVAAGYACLAVLNLAAAIGARK